MKRVFGSEAAAAAEVDESLVPQLKKQRPLLGAMREVMGVQCIQKHLPKLEPFLRRVVQEEVGNALCRFVHSSPRLPINRIQAGVSRRYQLQFQNSLPQTLFTCSRIEAEGKVPVEIVMMDTELNKKITCGPLSKAKIEILVLDGDFGSDDQIEWTEKEFNEGIVREREGKRPLLTGDLMITLNDGVGCLGDVSFTDNSSWIRSRKFRLGMRLVQSRCIEASVQEAISGAPQHADGRDSQIPNLKAAMLRASATPAATAAAGPLDNPAQCRGRLIPSSVRFPPARSSAASSAVRCSAVEFSAAASSATVLKEGEREREREKEKEKGLAERLMKMGSLVEDGLSYKESFIVRCYEVGINKTATVETIANLLQEVGCNHAQSVGFSTDGFATTTTMRKLRLIWVTSRMHIEIYKYPAWGDVVEIETWCQGEGRIGTRRDWILKDLATGSVIGRATSKWVMMNQDTRKLQRVSDEVREEYLVFCPRTPRFAFPEEDNSSLKKIPKLGDPAQHSRLGLVPRRADLDMNQHVNNVTYIGWVLESMPQEIIDTHELQTITLDYRRECQHDDTVDSLTSSELAGDEEGLLHYEGTNGSATGKQQDRCQFLHFLRLGNSGLEINRGRTEWRKLAR